MYRRRWKGKHNLPKPTKEDDFEVTYSPKHGYRCIKNSTELRFVRRNGLYVCALTIIWDISAPIIFLSKLKSIDAAEEFVKKAGFVSEQEALGMARDGNIVGLPVTADDIRLAYRIYGASLEFVKGREV